MVYFILFFLLVVHATPYFLYRKNDRSLYMPSQFVLYLKILPSILAFFSYGYFLNVTYSDEVYDKGMLAISLYSISYFFTYFILKVKINKFITMVPRIKKIKINFLKLILFSQIIIFILSFFLLIKLVGINPFANPLGFRIHASHSYGFINAFLQFSIIFNFFIVLYLRKEYKIGKRVLYIVMILTVIFLIASGSRGLLLQLILIYFLIHKYYYNKEISIIKIIFYFILLIPIFVLYNAYRLNSDVSFLHIAEIILRFDGIKNFFNYIDLYISTNDSITYGKSLLDSLLILVPRSLYLDKSIFTSMAIHSNFSDAETNSMGILNFSSPYFLAEGVMNFGIVFGPIAYGFLFANFIYLLDRNYILSYKDKTYFFSFILLYSFIYFNIAIIFEGFNGSYFQTILFSFILLNIIYVNLKIKPRRG